MLVDYDRGLMPILESREGHSPEGEVGASFPLKVAGVHSFSSAGDPLVLCTLLVISV